MFLLFSFDEWWQLLNTAQQVFWVIALIASFLFVAIFGLSLIGLNVDSDVDVDHAAGHDFSVDQDFSAFSVRSIVAFLTFFGWSGVYFLSVGHSVVMSVLFSFIAGLTAMFVVAYMIFKFAQLEQSGTVNPINAIESTGEVYLSIPEQGRGKIHIIVDGSMHEFDAETKGQALMTGSQIKVIDVLENDVMLVEPVILALEQQ